jgi:mannosyl-oligosaccharide alpha-1,2-mannosidase
MLGATRTGALVDPVSVPPREAELSEMGNRDWKTGVELVKTCMDTHDTATYVLHVYCTVFMIVY